jgi:hypothetical protein
MDELTESRRRHQRLMDLWFMSMVLGMLAITGMIVVAVLR